jgi:hypothetical protein
MVGQPDTLRNAQWLTQRIFAGTLLLLATTMNASTTDTLDPAAVVRAKVTLSARNEADTVQASMTFQADGLQLLAPGGRVTVNDVELAPARLQKQGYWYVARLKRAPSYVVQYALAAGQPVRTQEVQDRPFKPDIPEVLSRSRGATIPYQGLPPGPNERLFVEITGGEGSGRWGVVIRALLEGNRIMVPAAALADARLGSARLYVGMALNQPAAAGAAAVARAVGSERDVKVTD